MTAALEGGKWSAACHGRTLPLGMTRFPCYRRLGGPQGRSGQAENVVPTRIRSRTVQLLVSRYIEELPGPHTHTHTHTHTHIYIYIYKYIYIYIYSNLSLRTSLFWDVKQLGSQLTDISAQPVGTIIKVTALPLKIGPIGFPDVSATTNEHGVTSQ